MSIARSYNEFAFKLFNKLASGKDENYFVSPYSIVAALSMCFAGAKKNTEKQLRDVLSYANLSTEFIHKDNSQLQAHLQSLSDQVAIHIANKLYPHAGFHIREDFIKCVSDAYKSTIEVVDYSNASKAAGTINGWVEEQTKGKIKDLIPVAAINDLTRLILINAIYFKGNWLNKFSKEATQKMPFKLQNGTNKDVEMMVLLNKKFPLLISPEGVKAMICELPYQGDSIAMSIILPHEGVSISEVEAQLNEQILASIFLQNTYKGKVHLYVPKFKFEKSLELNDVLNEMGASDAFDAAKADFNGITDDPRGLFISKVVHKAVIEVNEEGTEAAAATGVIMMTRCAVIHEPPPEEFKCDRPFLFVIHEKRSNTILFMGKYAKP